MTNEEAIKILKDAKITYIAPNGNLISRKDTIEWLKKVTVTDGITFETGFKQILTDIEQMPRAEVRPMQVELKADGYADGELVYDFGKCPKCGWIFEEGDKDWEEPYCCHCGQKLKWFESEEEE